MRALALLVLLAAVTITAAVVLVMVYGMTWRQVWEMWRDAMLWALTYGKRGRWPL